MRTYFTREGKELKRKAYKADLRLRVSGFEGCRLMPQTLERCRGVERKWQTISPRGLSSNGLWMSLTHSSPLTVVISQHNRAEWRWTVFIWPVKAPALSRLQMEQGRSRCQRQRVWRWDGSCLLKRYKIVIIVSWVGFAEMQWTQTLNEKRAAYLTRGKGLAG